MLRYTKYTILEWCIFSNFDNQFDQLIFHLPTKLELMIATLIHNFIKQFPNLGNAASLLGQRAHILTWIFKIAINMLIVTNTVYERFQFMLFWRNLPLFLMISSRSFLPEIRCIY